MQQPSGATVVYGTAPQQAPTVVQTVTTPTPTVRIRQTNELRFKKLHLVLGIIQMSVGALCFFVSVVGFIVGGGPVLFGSGIYTGIIFCVTGILAYFAAKNNNRCCLISALVMNIIGSCVAIIGMSFAAIEVSMIDQSYYRDSQAKYHRVKCGIVISACILQLVLTIVHASFICASCCSCCLPREIFCPAPQVTGSVVVQPGQYLPQGQVYQYQGHMPQQQYVVQQPGFPGRSNQPPQNYPQYQQSTYPQQGAMGPPPVNPTFSHEAGGFDAPPPYSEAMEPK